MFSIDQLVCEYYNCSGGDYCVRGYEVCDENPSWVGDTCIAVLQRNDSELKVVYQSCFIRDAGTFHENCILREQPANVYSCLCNTTLCNGIDASFIPPSNSTHTSTYKPTGNCDNFMFIVALSMYSIDFIVFRMYSCV